MLYIENNPFFNFIDSLVLLINLLINLKSIESRISNKNQVTTWSYIVGLIILVTNS